MAGKVFDFMKIRTFGVGGRQRECERLLSEKIGNSSVGELLLLPIPTTRDGKHITGDLVALSQLVSYASADTAVVGYGIPSDIADDIRGRGGLVFDAGEDGEFLEANADITARGALGWILREMPKDAPDMKIGIIGYGRIGRRLAELLLFLGAEIVVYTTRESLARELCAVGISARSSDWEPPEDGLDLLVNTAPARLLSPECEARTLSSMKILDLASGKIFGENENLVKLSSIPEAFYPTSAGKVYADRIIKFLAEAER